MKKRILVLLAFLLGASRAAGCSAHEPEPDAAIAGPATGFSGPISPQGGTVTNSATLNGSLTIGTGATAIGNYAGSACGSGQYANALNGSGNLGCGVVTSGITNTAGSGVLPVTTDSGGDLGSSHVFDTGSQITVSEGVEAASFQVTSSGPTITEGSSAPSGSCSNGSVYLDTNGGSVWGCVGTAWLPMVADVIAATLPGTSTNDWNPTNLAVASTLAVTTTGATNTLTGLTAPSAVGRRITIVNVDATFNLLIASNSSSSSAANRITGPWGSVNIMLPGGANASVTLEYESTSRWRIIAYSLNDYPSIISDSTYTIGGSSGPTWSSGSAAPSGSCTTGSLYSRTSGSVGFYVCASSAWLTVITSGGITNSAGSGTVPVTADGSGDLGSSSLKDDGTSVTVQGLKPTVCASSYSGIAGITNLPIPSGCTYMVWTPTSNQALVGLQPPSSGSQTITIYENNSLGGNYEIFPLNSNATTTAWQIETPVATWLSVDSMLTWTYDSVNSKWSSSAAEDIGNTNVNGALEVTANATIIGQTAIVGNSFDSYFNYGLGGDDYIRGFNASTGTIHIGDGTSNGTAQVDIGDATTPTAVEGQLTTTGTAVASAAILTPTPSTGYLNDYSPSGWGKTVEVLEINATAGVILTSLVKPSSGSQNLTICATTGGTLQIDNEGTDLGGGPFGTAANRFLTQGGTNWIALNGGTHHVECADFYYSPGQTRWIQKNSESTINQMTFNDGLAALSSGTTIEGLGVSNSFAVTGGALATLSGGATGINGYGATHLEWSDDWLGLNISSAPLTATNTPLGNMWTLTTSGSPVGAYGVAGKGRPGITALDTGATTAGITLISTDATAVDFTAGNWTAVWVGGWPTLSSTSSSVTARYTSLVGFFDTTTINPANGCYFLYDAGNAATGGANSGLTQDLEAVCITAGTRTIYLLNGSGNCDASFAKGTVTAAALTLPNTNIENLKVVMTGHTEADFYANSVQVCKITSNIPAATSVPMASGFGIWAEATGVNTAARQIYTDYTLLSVDMSAVRSP